MRISLAIGICLTALGLLTACTRNRSTPEAAATSAAPPITVVTSTTSLGNGEPAVTVVATPVVTTAVVAEGTPALTAATIDYHVKEGDTLLSVAQKFEVDAETVRQLNYLLDDAIFVGQILQMPNKEGATSDGLPTPTPEPYRYVVEEGDSLGTIAQQFGVSAVSIMENNNLQDPNNVFVGQVLLIPNYVAPSSTATDDASTNTDEASDSTSSDQSSGEEVGHVVQPGETLYGIAQKYGVDANTLAETNNVTNRNQLRVGQKLIIPGITVREAAAALGRVHIVQSGESLTAIAQLYGVSSEEIISFNNITNPDAIYVGQELVIPGQ